MSDFNHVFEAINLDCPTMPKMRMVAIYLAARSKIVEGDEFDDSDPTRVPRYYFSIRDACDWLGWHQLEVSDALCELIEWNIIKLPRVIIHDRNEFTYVSDERRARELLESRDRERRRPERVRSIYVIVAPDGACKIGISFDPEERMMNLEGSDPLRKLTLSFTRSGPSSAIGRAERRAHEILAEHALGREWFRVSVQTAIDAVNEAVARELAD